MNRTARFRLLVSVVAAASLVVPSVAALDLPTLAKTNEDASCYRLTVSVRLFEEDSPTHPVAGWLCARGPLRDGQTVIIASPTGLSDHSYWDWPVHKELYSFVRYATQAGFAVFNYDRIGTGRSDRPAAALVNVESEAFVLHQLVLALRNGAFEGVDFGKVVLVGNSLSSIISTYEAGRFGGIDGLINTGTFVGPYPQGLATLFAAFYPAQLDPKFANREDVPLGYATTQPGSRTAFFYRPSADPAVIALDEELKDTATVGEAATFPLFAPMTQNVHVPVLSVMGDRDFLFCNPRCEADGVEVAKERSVWPSDTCLEIELVADTGHFVQLHPESARTFGSLARDWIVRRVGTALGGPAAQPCSL